MAPRLIAGKNDVEDGRICGYRSHRAMRVTASRISSAERA
jgi:hypothetical protein